MKNKIPTIGFFSPRLDAHYQTVIWNGIMEQAHKSEVKLICFPGERINARENFEYQANIVYKLACKENIDGIIILTLAIGTYLSKSELKKFCHSYHPIPVVSVGYGLPKTPTITVDNQKGMKQLIKHMVTSHHYKNFAFIGSPQNHREADTRMQALKTELKRYNLELDEDLVVSGNFVQESGMKAIDILLNQRKKKFEVVVAANDYMAIGALETLKTYGFRVPDDVAVVGFDDIHSSSFCTPPITTVYQPIYELGKQALEMVLNLVHNKETPHKVILPTKLVIRESCGCFRHNSTYVKKSGDSYNTKAIGETYQRFKEAIISDYKNAPPLPVYSKKKNLETKWLTQLIDAFYNDYIEVSKDHFITLLNTLLRNSITEQYDVLSWNRIITSIRTHTLAFNINKEKLLQAEYLWDQARVLISEISYRLQSFKRMEAERLSRLLWQVGNVLITSFDIGKLITVIADSIVKLGIKRCYFSVFDTESDTTEMSYLLLAYNQGKIRKLPKRGLHFKSNLLIPPALYPKGKSGPFIIEPLYFRSEQLGFIIFEMSGIENTIYDALRQQLSSALKGAFLMQEIKNHARHLTKEVTERTADLIVTNKQLQREIVRRKKVDAALKESEKNLRTITEATPIPLVIIRMQDGHILYSNNPFLYEFGLKEKPKHNERIHQFFNDPDYIEELFEKLKKIGKLVNIELPARSTDGRTFSVISSFQTLKFRGERAVIAGFYNITERKRLEKEILEISGREQRRIGQDLHDDLCQNMAGIAVMVSALENNLKNIDSVSAEKAGIISQLINETIVKTRNLARGLYPAALEE
ncbi:MAG: substrate-binding domain-containing protein, partial [Spirochaetales bacterium]|nr:substrate-binding domain-containing protein [Spirochaetales bacterium]